MLRHTFALLVLLTGLAIRPALADSTYLSGRIVNVTSASDGLFIMLDTGVPTNCTGVPFGWMEIPEASKTMIAVALITWQNQGSATVYTNALVGNACVINQFDPNTPIA